MHRLQLLQPTIGYTVTLCMVGIFREQLAYFKHIADRYTHTHTRTHSDYIGLLIIPYTHYNANNYTGKHREPVNE